MRGFSHTRIEILQNKPVAVYGAGSAGRSVARFLQRLGILPVAFIDSKKVEPEIIDGVPLVRLDSDKTTELKKCAIVLGIFNPYVHSGQLAADLALKGFGPVINFVQFFRQLETIPGLDRKTGMETYWLDDSAAVGRLRMRMGELLQLFGDQKSRTILEQLVSYRESGAYDNYPVATLDDQYLPEDLVPVRHGQIPFDTFVDCGAFTGDTQERLFLLASPPNIQSMRELIAFEPDLANYARLVKTSLTLAEKFRHVSFRNLPCAVSRQTQVLQFKSTGLGSSALGGGGEPVQAIALDDVLAGTPPSSRFYLKMDLEGAELDALEGARRFITTHRPGLAISSYHKSDHLWQIPLLIANLGLDYRLTLRQHGQNGMDTVLYATPW